MTVFTVIAGGNDTTVVMSDFLETVADAEKRDILLFNKLPQFFRNVRGIFLVDAAGTARENNTLQNHTREKNDTYLKILLFHHNLSVDKTGEQFTVNVELYPLLFAKNAYLSRDERSNGCIGSRSRE